MSATRWALILSLAIAALAGGWWYWTQQAPPPAPIVAAPPPPAPVIEAPPPPADYPVPEPTPEAPALPGLADSDAAFAAGLAALPGAAPLADWLISDQLIRRIVVTVDNLPGDRVALKLRPLKAVGGQFDADGGETEGRWQIGVVNAARYGAAVTVLQAIDEQALVALYFRWYPRFQQAYRELGYPDRRFNNRVIEVLDHLIGTPEIAEPIALVKPRVYWEYADPALESASAGRRLLWRIGAGHRTTVKAKLIAIRGRIVAAGIAPSTP